jgi:hypothetical protein
LPESRTKGRIPSLGSVVRTAFFALSLAWFSFPSASRAVRAPPNRPDEHDDKKQPGGDEDNDEYEQEYYLDLKKC